MRLIYKISSSSAGNALLWSTKSIVCNLPVARVSSMCNGRAIIRYCFDNDNDNDGSDGVQTLCSAATFEWNFSPVFNLL